MTDTLIVFPPDDTTDPYAVDSIPVSWSRPEWAVDVQAFDGDLLYYGQWVVANPSAQVPDRVEARVSGSDEFRLTPDGAVVAVSQPITVEMRTGGPTGSSMVLDLAEARGLAAVLRVLCAGASTAELAA